MSYANYHREGGKPALSSSILKILATRSPYHAWCAHPVLNPDYREEHSDVFDYGTAAHALLLEGSETNLCVVDANDWRTKVAQLARDTAREKGQTPILARQLTKVRKMVYAAKEFIEQSEYPNMMELGVSEKPVAWNEQGVHCIAKPDRLHMDVIMDYKSCDNAAPEAFSRQIGRMGYDLQAVFYMRGVPQAKRFLFLAQETDEPFACSWHSLAPSMAEIANMRVDRAIATWRSCLASGKWPAYSTDVHFAEAPHWMLEVAEQIAEEKEAA